MNTNVSEQFYTRGQNFNYELITKTSFLKHTFRFTVHTDSYTNQAYAVAEIFDREANRWNSVYRVPGELLIAPVDLAYMRLDDDEKAEACKDDVLEMMRRCAAIVGTEFAQLKEAA